MTTAAVGQHPCRGPIVRPFPVLSLCRFVLSQVDVMPECVFKTRDDGIHHFDNIGENGGTRTTDFRAREMRAMLRLRCKTRTLPVR